MTQINLLPWRERERQKKKKQFLYMVAGCIVFTIFLVGLVHFYYNGVIDYQKKRNAFLQAELDQEQVSLAALNKKQKELTEIDAQLHFIISLRDVSFRTVRLLDELVKVVPESVSLNKITRQGNSIVILGKAQSDVQITLFMKNISKSRIFKQPELTEISSKENVSGSETYFQLKVEQQG